VIALDIVFAQPARCAIGLGGQTNTTYSSCSYPAQDVRIWTGVLG
jgi:hypothetical protein